MGFFGIVNPINVLANGGIFTAHQDASSIKQGSQKLTNSIFDGLNLPFKVFDNVIEHLVKPGWVPPSWYPPAPPLENIVDPTSWIGSKSHRPIDPREDPFYHPDISKYQNLKPGEIIDIREVGLSAVWINVKNAYQISYRTENTFGAPAADVTTVIIPNNDNGKVISYQMWEDASSLQCSPSYSMVTGFSDPTIDVLLALGFVVNFPDHQGVNSAFGCGVREGKSTTDSLRAYLTARENINLKDHGKIVMWGYSGGSIATGHSIETMGTYAPDLVPHIKGALVGGVITNLTQVIQMINKGIFAGFASAGISGLITEYPDVKRVVDRALRPSMRKRFSYSSQRCFTSNLLTFTFQNIWGYFNDPSGQSILWNSDVQKALTNEDLGVHASPPTDFPIMIYQGALDEIAGVDGVDRTVDHWCQNGAHIDYYRLSLGAHAITELGSNLECLVYIYKFFDDYVPTTCTSHKDAIKGTSMALQIAGAQYAAFLNHDWKGAGIYDVLKKEGYYNGTSA